ncbi:hypothetical protein OXX79_007057 [Metschnikowia pulcherrima]
MSVNFNKPHEIDVPVMDLDDPEDDILFGDSRGRGSHRFLDSMDPASPNRPQNNPGIFDKIQNYFRTNRRQASYELMDDQSDMEYFNVDDDDAYSSSETGPDLRKYQIKRLEQKLNKTILCFACGLVFVFAFLFLQKDSFGNPNSASQKIILSNSTHNFHPTTLMISLDGFHPHYISADTTPTLHKMLVEGYGAPYMVPSFPSSTFPNHWTLVTGLYPADHGIVGNTFYDPKLKKQFINTNPDYGLDPDFWQGGEPVWTTAAKQGVKSAIHMWPGSEVPTVGDKGPLFIDQYNGTEPLPSKIDRVFKWIDIDNLAERPELILAYVPTIDQIGHKFGISGPELTAALHSVDDFVRLAQEKLLERNLQNIVNMIIVSDHGMAPTSNDRLLFLDDVVDTDEIEHVDGWPLFGLRPKNDVPVDKIYNEIKEKLAKPNTGYGQNFTLYKVEDFPPEWQFGGNTSDHVFNYRLAPLWIVPDVGYSVTTRQKYEENNNNYYPKGVHGYNNTHLLMRAIFLGQGPYFEERLAKTKKVLPFSNVNVYNIVCDTLKVQPSPNNGTHSSKALTISAMNSLPENWSDDLVYPDLPYEVEHIVRNATYDQLWRSSGNKITPQNTGVVGSSTLIASSSLVSSVPNSLPPSSQSRISSSSSELSMKAQTETSTESGNREGFFGHFLGDVGDFIDDVDNALEDAFEDAVDYADSWFDGNS